MTPRIAKTLSLFAGIVLLLTGALAFIPNPLVGPEGIIARDPLAAYIPIIFGLVLLLGSWQGEGAAAFALYMVGGGSLLLAVVSYLQMGGGGSALLLDTLRLRMGDITFYGIAGVVLVICGKMNTSKQQLFYN